jgi:hypothetical protein
MDARRLVARPKDRKGRRASKLGVRQGRRLAPPGGMSPDPTEPFATRSELELCRELRGSDGAR